MKKIYFIIVILISITSVSFAADPHLIFVNGVAERTVEPNMLIVRFESWAKASSAQKAQEQQAIQFAKLKSQLDKFKIKKEDIQTESFNVSPEYTYDQKAQLSRISGYRVSHSVMVIYRKIEDAGNFLDEVVGSRGDYAGVNVSGVSWDYDKKSQLEMSALADAVKNARARANELANAAGVSIKAVHKISHQTYTPPTPQPMYERAVMMKAADSVAPSTELSSGQIKARVEVQMEFEI